MKWGGLLFLGLVAPVLADAATLVRDVTYGEAGGETQRLDICTPDGAGPFPVVILVHGGGWSGGDKAGADKPNSGADITPWFAPLTDAGIAWVSINYRLAPAHRWPAQLDDTRAAVAWVRTHIAEHRGDPARLALMGHSAGGQLAFMAALPEAGQKSSVTAVVGCAPVLDFVADAKHRGELSKSLRNLYALPPEPTPAALAILAAGSPLGRIGPACPPVLLLHGDADRTVPIAQSLAFQEKARAAGLRCDLHVLPAAPHRLTEWASRDPNWSRVLTDWLKARWSESDARPKF